MGIEVFRGRKYYKEVILWQYKGIRTLLTIKSKIGLSKGVKILLTIRSRMGLSRGIKMLLTIRSRIGLSKDIV